MGSQHALTAALRFIAGTQLQLAWALGETSKPVPLDEDLKRGSQPPGTCTGLWAKEPPDSLPWPPVSSASALTVHLPQQAWISWAHGTEGELELLWLADPEFCLLPPPCQFPSQSAPPRCGCALGRRRDAGYRLHPRARSPGGRSLLRQWDWKSFHLILALITEPRHPGLCDLFDQLLVLCLCK